MADDLQKAAEELMDAKVRADTANAARGDFLANMSHEIRTPMHAILGFADLTLDSELTTDQKEHVQAIRDAGETLLILVNDILDLSRIDAGKLELDRVEFDIRNTVGDAVAMFGPRAHRKGIELSAAISSQIPGVLIGDPSRLRQVLVNLVGNAVKFTDNGAIHLTVVDTGASDTDVVLSFELTDTGSGIPEGVADQIFEAFRQGSRSVRRQHGGTGLGLAITSQLVHAMGGSIEVRSAPGQGSTFTFVVPYKPAVRASLSDRAIPFGVTDCRVLVVEPHAASRTALTETLHAWRLDCEAVETTPDALKKLRVAAEAGDSYQIIMAAWTSNSIETTRLAESVQTSADLGAPQIILLTSGHRLDSETARSLGIQSQLSKPVRPVELRSAIKQTLGSDDHPDDRTLSHKIAPEQLLHVLVVDNNAMSRRLTSRVLEGLGHSVTVAEDGLRAVELAKSSPDLILMDLYMPQMDGTEATMLIRRDEPDGRHVPIWAMTASAAPGDRDRCLEAGMDDYLPKPLRARDLIAKVSELSSLGQDEEAADGDGSNGADTSHGDKVDWKEAMAIAMEDKALLRELAQLFVEEHAGLLSQLGEAAAANAAQGVVDTTHKLKGSLRYFGRTRALAIAEDLERMGRSGLATEATRRIPELREATAALAAELRSYLAGTHEQCREA
jgi:CheY-like chemotaxis protein